MKPMQIILPALVLGGACGAGVGMGLYPSWVGVLGAVIVAVGMGVLVRRAKQDKGRAEGQQHRDSG